MCVIVLQTCDVSLASKSSLCCPPETTTAVFSWLCSGSNKSLGKNKSSDEEPFSYLHLTAVSHHLTGWILIWIYRLQVILFVPGLYHLLEKSV